ncbi:unnamed protein product [Rotaria socialis]|uniref:DDE-1 domain-containing protein n=1 Tax=Rotaria socialis TaxID=392032 RepID=A0A821VNJ4_9BILA|nr:unnamed protein product [Rotaria socialis]CAF4910003.1 unnamed protein product [Rotaria socialis]
MRQYKKKIKTYTEKTIEKAIEEINDGASIRETARKYNMSFFMLRNRHKKQIDEGTCQLEDKRGKKIELPESVELKLKNGLLIMEKMGLGPTMSEFKGIVQDYLEGNEIANKFNNNLPGYEWVHNFLLRHNLSLKKGGMMQIARKTVTSDPFVIYSFYELLGSEMNRLGIMNRPECIWNLDETSFPQDPSKTKTIGSKGNKTVRLTCGSGRENVTVLATVNAAGIALDPLIVFQGKNLQNTWIGNPDKTLPNTGYAVSDNGWMTAKVFEQFFSKFIEHTKDCRPTLLILDGHLSHTSMNVLDMAEKNEISILKLPAHCTDLLQPLDVACCALGEPAQWEFKPIFSVDN